MSSLADIALVELMQKYRLTHPRDFKNTRLKKINIKEIETVEERKKDKEEADEQWKEITKDDEMKAAKRKKRERNLKK